jgi:hypothetical protein
VGATLGVRITPGGESDGIRLRHGLRRGGPYGNLEPIWSGLRATSLTRVLLPGHNLSLLTNHFSLLTRPVTLPRVRN